MHAFTILFILAVLLGLGLRLWLGARQIDHVRTHRDAVPPAFVDNIPLDSHQRAADYTVDRARFGRLEYVFEAIVVLVWTLGGGLAALDQAWRALSLSPLLTGTGVLLSAFLIMGLIDLPFSVWRTFVIETRHGFNRTTPGVFAADLLKQTLLMLVIGIPLALLVLWLMQGMGELWWLWVWAVWTVFSLGLAWAYPRIIAPLFNKFSPLDDGELRERVARLLDRAGFRSRGIFVMDGSRRSGHGNAYFTGFGRNKRIVFFDTLLETLAPEEVEAVLAHELGHFRHRHVLKGMVVMTALSLAGLALLAWLMQQSWFYSGLGVQQPSTWMALLLFMIALPQFTYLLTPLFSWRSRRQEFQADAYASEQTGSTPLIHALTKLYRDNASTLTPDPVHSAFYDSHPPASIRIQHLSALGR
ncbi:MAG: M48 family metallopeptidase [Acidihalobacter sp.]|uniref:M48 family metallopeptidase n=1 Tax=Acidihalobacter sp. TaxID=1872108 RepID=UPI00307D1E07